MTETEGDAFTEAVRTALDLLSSPEIVILVRRQHATSTWMGTVVIAGEWAGLHVPQPGGEHQLLLFPAASALDRVAEWCGLAGNSVPGEAALTVTGTQLLEAGERASGGDLAAAEAVLGPRSGDAASRLARALATQPVAVHVTVLDGRTESRLEGTVTGWLDGGQWGLWRVPPSDGPEDAVELRLVSKADLLEEICEGFPDLRA